MNLKELIKNKFDFIFFYLGLFLLPSAFALSLIFLFISLIFGTLKNKENYFLDKWNLPFLISSFLMITSCLVNIYFPNNIFIEKRNSLVIWIDLFNWLPFFWAFWGFQYYLKTSRERKTAALFLLSGTFPLIISGIGQLFLGWFGPLETMNGLIVWYQRPLSNSALTSVFNNPNYAGAWFNIIWPFSLATAVIVRKFDYKKIIILFFQISISLMSILTYSRAAWFGLFLAIPLMKGLKKIKLLFFSLIAVFILICSSVYPIFGKRFQLFMEAIIPYTIKYRFSTFDFPRILIWKNGFEISLINPFIGLGGNAFPPIFKNRTDIYNAHSHNLVLDFAIKYGYPATFLTFFVVFSLIFLCFKKFILAKNPYSINSIETAKLNIFEKAWSTSLLIIFLMHMIDIQYFDGRISLAMWLLLAGARNMIKLDHKSEK